MSDGDEKPAPDPLVICPCRDGGCGATYTTLDAFRALPLDTLVDLADGIRLELRRCECDTLLGLEIDPNGNPIPLIPPSLKPRP